jgi:hypothetical protein
LDRTIQVRGRPPTGSSGQPLAASMLRKTSRALVVGENTTSRVPAPWSATRMLRRWLTRTGAQVSATSRTHTQIQAPVDRPLRGGTTASSSGARIIAL